ncbi:MAG: hypothetical protein FWH56_07600 [Betaproteobacteria bacterium]|nr:hypothetical protein [Betaproteobacteria bacterium]
MPVSDAFARILATERAQFNARAAEAVRRAPGFDAEAFAAFLQSGVDGVVAAVADAVPERAAAVAGAAYDIALTLVAQRLVGSQARGRLVERVWRESFPACARRIAEAPDEVLGALSNAALYMGSAPELRGDEWLRCLSALAGNAETVPQLLALGKALAWRAGAAHFRDGALVAASMLPEPLALAAVGAAPGSSWARVHARLAADPWWLPEWGEDDAPSQRNAQGKKIGDFSGFGGIFRQPPEIRANPDGFWVKSGDRYSLLMVDARGAVLHRASREEYEQPPFSSPAHRSPVVEGNRLMLAHGNIELDLPAEGLSIACNAHTVAVTSPYSFTIRLFPLQ